MIRSLIRNKKTIWELGKNDCRARYSSSILGAIWMILQPLTNMLVIWLVFEVGFKASNLSEDVPFIIWYMPAFLVWNFFQESLSQASGSLLEYSYLVKKVNFEVEIIPPIKIVSNSFVHVFFMFFIIFVNFCYGKMPTIFYLQVFYYYFCAAALALAFGWFFSAFAPFATDITNVVAIILQIGFWITPIFWDPSSLTDTAMFILKLNPMYYVCMGYRDCFVYNMPFYKHPLLACYFWFITISIWFIGTRLYKKSKKHFVDVL